MYLNAGTKMNETVAFLNVVHYIPSKYLLFPLKLPLSKRICPKDSYCMTVYCSQIWAFNKTYLNKFYVTWRKAIRRIWKLPYRTHNNLFHLINLCLPIDVTLEKRCINYIGNLINGENNLYDSISKLSLCNNSTTLGEKLLSEFISDMSNYSQGRPQDLGGGGAKKFFFRFENLHVAKRHAAHGEAMRIARGVRGHAPPRKFFKTVQFGAF